LSFVSVCFLLVRPIFSFFRVFPLSASRCVPHRASQVTELYSAFGFALTVGPLPLLFLRVFPEGSLAFPFYYRFFLADSPPPSLFCPLLPSENPEIPPTSRLLFFWAAVFAWNALFFLFTIPVRLHTVCSSGLSFLPYPCTLKHFFFPFSGPVSFRWVSRLPLRSSYTGFLAMLFFTSDSVPRILSICFSCMVIEPYQILQVLSKPLLPFPSFAGQYRHAFVRLCLETLCLRSAGMMVQ